MKKYKSKSARHYFQSGMLSLSFWALFMMPVNAQPSNIDIEKLNIRIKDLVGEYNIPDPQVVVFRNDSVLYKFPEKQENERNNYLIGSCSKSFTALSVLMLAEKKKIDIDNPVKKYLPWFTLKDERNIDKITVRHLLNHTSGIGSDYGFFDYKTTDYSIYKSKLIEHLEKIQLSSEPGNAFCYSNFNYLLLGLIVESVTNEKYGKFLSENVFQKIGMNKTYAGFDDYIMAQNVQPYQYYIFRRPLKSKAYIHSDNSLAYGYISSNTKDLEAYLNFMINNGITEEGDTLISSEGYQNLITPLQGEYGYGMGWIRMNYNGADMIFHTGLEENYSSILTFCPVSKAGIVVLCNVNSFEFCTMVQNSILDMLANKPTTGFFSMEVILRWVPGILVIITLVMLAVNILRWKKYSMKTGLLLKPIPLVRLIAGMGLSITGIVLIYKAYGISIFSVTDFQPDIVWSLIIVMVLGIMSSFARYFGTYSKKSMLNSMS